MCCDFIKKKGNGQVIFFLYRTGKYWKEKKDPMKNYSKALPEVKSKFHPIEK